MLNVPQYEDMVNRPGKFQGEKRYVPFFWLDCDPDSTDGNEDEGEPYRCTYLVTPEDIGMFPELEGRTEIRLMERSDGFVCEVTIN